MSLSDKIQDDLVADQETILENHLGDLGSLLQLHEDGSINLRRSVRKAGGKTQVLVYLLGQRYAFEGELVTEPTLPSRFFAEKIGVSNRSIRNYLSDLRQDGLVKSPKDGTHEIIVENIPIALDTIEEELKAS